jgi:chromosome segregation ATPase
MQPESGPKDLNQALQVIAWLQEERQRDKVELQKLQHQLEQLGGRFRDVFGRLDVVEGELRLAKSQAGQTARVDDALRQLREAQTGLEGRLEGVERASTLTRQTLAVETERERRAVADLQTQIVDYQRELDDLKARQVVLAEELRRDRTIVPPLQQDVAQVVERAQNLSEQITLLQDGLRHRDASLLELTRQSERLGAEQLRFTDWQRLAEVRWTRQLTEWQQQMGDWQHQAEMVALQMESAAKLFPSLKDEVVELRRALGDEREQYASAGVRLTELESTRAVDRDEIKDLCERVSRQSERLDEVASFYHSLVDRLERQVEQVGAVESRLRTEKERGESAVRVLARLDTQDESLSKRLEELALDLATFRRQADGRTEKLEHDLGEQGRRLSQRVQELERLDAEHKQREIDELEQQIREMQERARQSRS